MESTNPRIPHRNAEMNPAIASPEVFAEASCIRAGLGFSVIDGMEIGLLGRAVRMEAGADPVSSAGESNEAIGDIE